MGMGFGCTRIDYPRWDWDWDYDWHWGLFFSFFFFLPFIVFFLGCGLVV